MQLSKGKTVESTETRLCLHTRMFFVQISSFADRKPNRFCRVSGAPTKAQLQYQCTLPA